MKLARILILVLLFFSNAGLALALSQDELNSLNGNTVWYAPTGNSSVAICSAGGGSGSISSNAGKGMTPAAQQKFQEILGSAGARFNVDPNFIAAFYYAENARTNDSTNNADSASPPPITGDGNWREPPSPYGTGAAWPPPNQYSAQGPFQFISSTWSSYGVDGNGDGKVDVNDLADASFAAAKLLAANGGTAGASQNALFTAARDYNHSDTYAQSVINTFNYLSGNSSCGGSGTYQNPLRDVPNVAQAGIDAGVDYSGDGPVYALGSGKVVFSSLDTSTGWVGGNAIAYTLTDGPATGRTVYVAENCTPKVSTGDQVTSSTELCEMHNHYPYIETGWAKTNTDTPWAYTDNCYYLVNPSIPNKTSTAYGVNFDSLMNSLGAPKASPLAPPVTCSLQHGSWPTW